MCQHLLPRHANCICMGRHCQMHVFNCIFGVATLPEYDVRLSVSLSKGKLQQSIGLVQEKHLQICDWTERGNCMWNSVDVLLGRGRVEDEYQRVPPLTSTLSISFSSTRSLRFACRLAVCHRRRSARAAWRIVSCVWRHQSRSATAI